MQEILDALTPMPASVVNERFDLLAWNAAYQVLCPAYRRGAPGERNSPLLLHLPGLLPSLS